MFLSCVLSLQWSYDLFDGDGYRNIQMTKTGELFWLTGVVTNTDVTKEVWIVLTYRCTDQHRCNKISLNCSDLPVWHRPRLGDVTKFSTNSYPRRTLPPLSNSLHLTATFSLAIEADGPGTKACFTLLARATYRLKPISPSPVSWLREIDSIRRHDKLKHNSNPVQVLKKKMPLLKPSTAKRKF